MGTLEGICMVFGKGMEVFGSTIRNSEPIKLLTLITMRTDDIGSFRLCISIDLGGCKGEGSQQDSAKDEPACSNKSRARILGHREVHESSRYGRAQSYSD